ncbi:hypothetical protein GH714_020189 [Hevea brasiliensis]|uniref:Uncharacterized protein n=1 Tax=Hevea brasiliensis TaxID=3981 RepID=A0A6A6MFC2_HEVBR|nr:hypothetical protein GH714_020189 [Hevea brasiliensis]
MIQGTAKRGNSLGVKLTRLKEMAKLALALTCVKSHNNVDTYRAFMSRRNRTPRGHSYMQAHKIHPFRSPLSNQSRPKRSEGEDRFL